MFTMYKMATRLMEFISFLNLSIELITRKESGKINIQIVVEAKLDNVYKNLEEKILKQ